MVTIFVSRHAVVGALCTVNALVRQHTKRARRVGFFETARRTVRRASDAVSELGTYVHDFQFFFRYGW